MTLPEAVNAAHAGKANELLCPAHPDRTPSLSVGPGADGKVLLYCFSGCQPEAILAAAGLKWADLFPERSCAARPVTWAKSAPKGELPWDNPKRRRNRANWPPFEVPTAMDLAQISDIRGIGREGLELAVARRILWIIANYHGHRCWVVTDSARIVAQARRLDGLKFQISGREEKALSLPGSSHKWPAGIAALNDGHRSILLTEGGPDLLAAFHFIACEGRERDASAVAILGAGSGIHESVLSRFKGRRVRIAQHADEPGKEAAERWVEQLRPHVEHVDGIDFAGLRQYDERPVEDLNDFARIHADDFEQHRWSWRILP